MLQFLLTHTPLLYLTQSVWRDEAFSILLAQKSPFYFIPNLTFEPPLYYLMLHFWMKLVGTGEIAVRSLSLLGFALAVIVVIFWGERLFKKHWLSWFLPVFFFFNPQMLYYAFEIRAYGWFIFFAVLSMFSYLERRISLYVIATALGIYTHTYMVMVPLVQVIHYIFVHPKLRRAEPGIWKDPMIRGFAMAAILAAPWIIKVATDLPRLQQSWYFPIDRQILESVFGNLFVGYEGTPHGLWNATKLLSLALLGATGVVLYATKEKARNWFFAGMAIVPPVLLLTISFFKPLFVNRYLMPSTIALVFVVVIALEQIKNTVVQKSVAFLLLAAAVGFNIWYPSLHAKQDIRTAVRQIETLAGPADVTYTDSPLILFETLYYSRDPSRVFWYNPSNSPFPWYIGDIVFSPDRQTNALPPYPNRAFILRSDNTFDVVYLTDVSYNTSAPQ